MVRVVSFVGKSNSGKTTLLEKVVKELKIRGFRVGVVKHTSHDFDIDHSNKDTWRLTQAGSDIVAISSAKKISLIEQVENEMPLEQIISFFKDRVDIVLTEGYKHSKTAKIEVSRSEQGHELLCVEDDLLAIVSDQRFPVEVPQFDLNDAEGVVTLLLAYMTENPELFRSAGCDSGKM